MDIIKSIMYIKLMSKKKHRTKKHLTRSQSQSTAPEGPFVYFLINESPPLRYSGTYSEVYDLLQSLFNEDPILEDDALEAISTLGLDAATILRAMTYHRYLHKATLKEVLK